MREEPVVGKETRVTDEVRVNKDVETETRRVGDEVRREDVKVDREESRGRKQRG
jgi:stress response protein YsnF